MKKLATYGCWLISPLALLIFAAEVNELFDPFHPQSFLESLTFVVLTVLFFALIQGRKKVKMTPPHPSVDPNGNPLT